MLFSLYLKITEILFLNFFIYNSIFFIFSIIFGFLFNNFLGLYGVWIVNIFALFLFWISTIFLTIFLTLFNTTFYINFGKWFDLHNDTLVYFEFVCDALSMGYVTLTSTIAISVIIYTFIYFRYEPLVDRLILLINSFVVSMIILVTASNLITLFLGWELIGLTSFFLINFWNTRVATLKSAFKAFVFNKFSDVSLLLGILCLYNETYSFDNNVINYQTSLFNNHVINFWIYEISFFEIVVVFFLLCAFIKSAQFGFHIWLPDSMEAPVPASALIHSATLVSAGIFIILRFHNLFEISWIANILFIYLGSFTAFFGGFCAIFQSDIKRLLAYSTISHCGFLFLTLSTHIYEYTIIYLYIHGLFKATSFLCVGNVIRFSGGYQDFRRMGNLCKYLPFEFFTLVICLFNLSGVPFSLGFFSKHVLYVGLNNLAITNFWFLMNFLSAAICGFYYSYRLIYNVFFDFKKSQKFNFKHTNWIKNNFTKFNFLFYNYDDKINSIQYDNSTKIGCISILFLLMNSYTLIIILFYWFFQILYFKQFYFSSLFFTIQTTDLFFSSLDILQNMYVFNFIVLIFIGFLLLSFYRYAFCTFNFWVYCNFLIWIIVFFKLFCIII